MAQRWGAAGLACALAMSVRAEELVLPAPAGATGAKAASFRVEATPRPDGAFDARVSVALIGGSAGERLVLTLPALPVSAVEVAAAPVPPPTGGRLEVDIGAQEALAVVLTLRVEPDLLDWVPAAQAGWLGRTRGPLLQPARRLVVRHPADSPFRDAAVSARIMTGMDLPVSALLQEPAGRLEQGSAAWEGRSLRPPESLSLIWPLLPGAMLPRDRPEAEALVEDLLQRDVPGVEFDRVRTLVAESGEPGASAAAAVLSNLASERNRQREAAERERRRQEEDEARRASLREAEAQAAREAAAREAEAQAAREAAAREAEAQAAREAAAREAEAQAAREAAAREAEAQAAREAAAREAEAQAAREAAAREVAEREAEARAQADREAAAREAAAREATEPRTDREAAAREAQERADREAAARETQERADREAAAREAQARADREAAAREAQARADREAAARETQERADREAAAREARERPAVSAAYRESLERAAAENAEREQREATARAVAHVSGIPWIRSADAARRFLGELGSRDGGGHARIEEAIALMRARWGEPFRYEKRWRERFENEPWYAPRREDALLPPTEGEVAALEILSAALR